VEQQLGKNLPGNFKTIDRFQNGVATSIKSMDIGATTYSNPAAITRVGRGYIDKVVSYRGGTWNKITIEPSQVQRRALDLAVPPGATTAQRNALQGLIEYGHTKGVKVNIVEME
jgi:filamentous hemagglutinin